jgi:amino acid transporter
MVIVAFVCLALPLRHYLKIQFVLWALGVLSIVLVFAILLGTTHEAFIASFNDFYRANNVTYSGVISAATAGGLSNPGLATWSSATLLAIPYLFFVVVGFQWPALVGGELKTPRKTMFYGCIIAGIVSVLVEAAGAFMIQGIVGPDFVNAAAYLSYVTGTYPAPIPFNPVFAAMTINRNLIVDTLLFLGLIAWGLLILCAGALVYTRVIMAWGFDRSLPAKLADVNERTHTPILAAAIFCALLDLGVIATVYAGVIFANVNMTLLLIILFTFVGLCAMLFPYRRKGMFEMSPLKTRKIGRVPTVAIVGVLNVVLFLFLIFFALTYPSLSGPTGALAFTVMGSVFLLGLVLFFVTRVYYKRMGIDTSLAFKEIPPE